jgi:hypothetical protein
MRAGLEWFVFRALGTFLVAWLEGKELTVEGRESTLFVDSTRLAGWEATEPRKGPSAILLLLLVGRVPDKPGSCGLADGLFWFDPTEEEVMPLVISALRD